MTWFSSAFYVIGGGPNVAMAVGITMVSDVVPSGKRASTFVYLTAGVLVAELAAPLLAVYLMQFGDWVPLLFALAIQQVGICIALLLPETLHLWALHGPGDLDEHELTIPPPNEHGSGLQAQIALLKDAFAFMKSNATLAIVILTFLGDRLGRHALSLLIRYASKRYSWRIQDVSSPLSQQTTAD
jgi:MFS family permease